MHDLALGTLDANAVKELLDETALALSDVSLSPETTTVDVAQLSFYDDYSLYALRDDASSAPNVHYLLHKPDDPVLLDGTNEPIYRVNQCALIQIEDATVVAYAKFFFHFVRGKLGSFMIVEKPEDVVWQSDTPQKQKDEVNALLMPVANNGIGEDNFYSLTATIIFKNALFRTDIKIAPFSMEATGPRSDIVTTFSTGDMILCNEKVLLEGLPVFPEPFVAFPAESIRD
ncbi:hypothetical protein [Oceanidesulfovibrio marinus]|uniref:Uncharacterized protein n=1 Tax=Oceanidesulfovibrio marinus TaxID=370038 RepID=A0A6P1ZFP8_9BACT|nr:hypothetical protein [Oceanidesulfovibrio marinus]TVM32142.1 hypothetical protein DQK91_16565 [Oceanidesulfovibrio marinus]